MRPGPEPARSARRRIVVVLFPELMLLVSKAKASGASTTGFEKPSCPFTSPGKFPVPGARSGSLLAAVRLAIGWRGSARLSFTVTLIVTATFRWSGGHKMSGETETVTFGGVLSIMKFGERNVAQLRAMSQTVTEPLTANPSPARTSGLVGFLVVSSPESASTAVHGIETLVVYQPFAPFGTGGCGVPKVSVGGMVSSKSTLEGVKFAV